MRVYHRSILGFEDKKDLGWVQDLILDRFTNAELHYLEVESGSILILLHGLGGNAWEWSDAIASLAEHYYVIAPDLIGFGGSISILQK